MLRRLIILLLIVGCDLFDSEDEVNQWTCKLKTDWDGPLIPDYFAPDTTIIYSSFERCDSVCVKDLSLVQVEGLDEDTIDYPYYCKEIN